MKRLAELTAAGSVSNTEQEPVTQAALPARPRQAQPASLPQQPATDPPLGASLNNAPLLHRISDGARGMPPGIMKAGSFIRRASDDRRISDGPRGSGPPALKKAESLSRQGSLVRISPHMSVVAGGVTVSTASGKLRQDASLLSTNESSPNRAGAQGLADGNGSYSEEDTLKLLDDVHEKVLDLTDRLFFIYGSINDINTRLGQVEAPPDENEAAAEQVQGASDGETRLELDI